MRINNYITLLLLAIFLLGCSGTSKIPDGDLLYVGHTITIEKGKEPKKPDQKLNAILLQQ